MVPEPADGIRPRRGFPRWVSLIIAVSVVGFIAAAVIAQWGNINRGDLRFQPLWLIAALPPMFAFQAIQGEVALIVLRRLHYPIPNTRGRVIFGASLLARYIPTGALAVAVRLGLNQQEGVPKRISTVAIGYEISVGLVGAGVSVLPLLPSAGTAVTLAAVIPLAGIVLLHPTLFARIVNRGLVKIGQPPLPRTLPFGEVLVIVAIVCVTFWLAGVSLLCSLLAITPVSSDDFVMVIATYGLGFITSMLGFALPGGLGAREAGLVAGLSLTTASPVAFVAAALSRLVQTAVELTYAGLAKLLDRLSSRGPAGRSARDPLELDGDSTGQ